MRDAIDLIREAQTSGYVLTDYSDELARELGELADGYRYDKRRDAFEYYGDSDYEGGSWTVVLELELLEEPDVDYFEEPGGVYRGGAR